MTDAQLALAPHRIPGPVAAALLAAGAVAPAQAARYAPADEAARADLARHLSAGTVRRDGDGDGALWLDLRRWYAMDRRRSRSRALVAAVLALVTAVVATLFYRL